MDTIQRYAIVRNNATPTYFTSSSSYEQSKWGNINEATKYITAELANSAVKKLWKAGEIFASIVLVTEDTIQPIPTETIEGPGTITPEPVVAITEESTHSFTKGQMVKWKGKSCKVIVPDGKGNLVGICSTDANPGPTHMVDAGDLTVAESVEEETPVVVEAEVPVIVYNDPGNLVDRPVTNLTYATAHDHEEKVSVPAEIKSSLKKVIDKFMVNKEDSYSLTAGMALQELLDVLEVGTVEAIKRAQLKMTSIMSPITNHIPDNVRLYIVKGGRKDTLKDVFDKKWEDIRKFSGAK